MRFWTLSENERAHFGHSHALEITSDDLTVTTAATGQTLTPSPGISFAIGDYVDRVTWYLATPFKNSADAASVTTTFSVGDSVGGVATLMVATQANENGTEILNQTCVPHVGTAATPVTGFTAATNLVITVGAPTALKTLNDINTGVLYIFLNVKRCLSMVSTFSPGPRLK
jgi:hypothetical protein